MYSTLFMGSFIKKKKMPVSESYIEISIGPLIYTKSAFIYRVNTKIFFEQIPISKKRI